MSSNIESHHTLSKDLTDVANWTGKKFGEFRGYRVIERNIRILSHTGGFAIFLPGEIWRKLDHQVPITFPVKDDATCSVADKDYAFVKYAVTPSELEGSYKDYASEDVNVVLDKVERFVRQNYFQNPQAYPDSDYFTHGSYKDYPDMPRPFRLRMGGHFHYKF